jgi:hypothetical protein
MSTCWQCGEDITFRYMDGRSTPIHLNGGWCQAQSEPTYRIREFRDVKCYIDPNAFCPVCGDRVFFYQNGNGSRVFFDNLGWPWPKHHCTDTRAAQTNEIKSLSKPSGKFSLKNSDGHSLILYVANSIRKIDDRLFVHV